MQIKRVFPELPRIGREPKRAISFVVVRYSDEYVHNFLRSECVRSDLNEVIEVDNTGNLYFNNLSQAMRHGVERAQNDLIAVVHEDVRLINGWQVRFEQSLEALEQVDDQWAIVGSVGWSKDLTMHGHWSDPFQYKNTFKDSGLSYAAVERLDEQLLVFNRCRLPDFDENLPGIHHIGHDLSLGLRKSGLKTYAIDAPTIHKYRDRFGRLVMSAEESEKINDRKSLTYLADKACCDDYFSNKWLKLTNAHYRSGELNIPFQESGKLSQLDRPVILLSRGGSGSRLLSTLMEDAGVFLGHELNISGDSMELVVPFYRAITEKYRCNAEWQKRQSVLRIKTAAASMIKSLPEDRIWGFKIPESIFLLPELISAFPEASYVHLVRDPISTCLRRTHMTARLDNHIGRITLPMAYDHLDIHRSKILGDSPAHHMAYTTLNQLELVEQLAKKCSKLNFLETRFENIISRPDDELTRLCDWLKVDPLRSNAKDQIDINRAINPKTTYPESVVADVKSILADVRHRLNYDTSL